MTFENLDSNFEKRVQEAHDKNASPEEQHFNKTQQVNQEKPKYENVMGSQLGSGLLSVFQNQLHSVRKPTDNSDSFDTITITTDDITKGASPSPTNEVSPEQIESLLPNKPTNVQESVTPTEDSSQPSKNPIEEQLNSGDIEVVSKETQTLGQTHKFDGEQQVEETISKVKPIRYTDTHPVQDKIAKEEDSISQIAVLRAANGEATSLGTDGKTMEDDYVAYQIQEHRKKKEEARLKGEKLSGENVISFENTEEVKEDNTDINSPGETILTEDDLNPTA